MRTWLPIYDEICSDFSFDPEDDIRSAELMASLLCGKGVECLEELRGRELSGTALLCGGAARLVDDLPAEWDDGPIVAADGAISALRERRVLPDIIVTDLDGDVEAQVDANRRGSVVFVHAHGDNMPALERWVAEFPGVVVGTCQCAPVEGVFNFGGFTDGDRAACILGEFGITEVALAGFDLESPSPKPGRSSAVKRRKLDWAGRIIAMLSEEGMRFQPVRRF